MTTKLTDNEIAWQFYNSIEGFEKIYSIQQNKSNLETVYVDIKVSPEYLDSKFVGNDESWYNSGTKYSLENGYPLQSYIKIYFRKTPPNDIRLSFGEFENFNRFKHVEEFDPKDLKPWTFTKLYYFGYEVKEYILKNIQEEIFKKFGQKYYFESEIIISDKELIFRIYKFKIEEQT